MAYQKEKLRQFADALATLEELVGVKKTRIIQDATIQRFEYTVEVCWKAIKLHLLEVEGVDSATPKSVIRDAVKGDVLRASEGQTALQMIDDRNKTSHLYNRAFADAMYKKIPKYTKLLRTLYTRLTQ